MSEDLTISVITYNRINMFKDFLDSYYRQKLNDSYDLLVIDNSNVENRIDYKTNIDLIRIQNKPLSLSLDYAIFATKTRYVMVCNDDIIFKDKIYEGIKLIESNKLINLCTFSCFVIDKSIIPVVGWFDLRFKDAGYDGSDYSARLKIHGIERIEYNRKKEFGYDYFVEHQKFKRNHQLPEWNYRLSHDFYYKKWNVKHRAFFKGFKPNEIRAVKMIDEIDWFPYYTELYKNGIWTDYFNNIRGEQMKNLDKQNE